MSAAGAWAPKPRRTVRRSTPVSQTRQSPDSSRSGRGRDRGKVGPAPMGHPPDPHAKLRRHALAAIDSGFGPRVGDPRWYVAPGLDVFVAVALTGMRLFPAADNDRQRCEKRCRPKRSASDASLEIPGVRPALVRSLGPAVGIDGVCRVKNGPDQSTHTYPKLLGGMLELSLFRR
jgi:hypothetical protein